jgi:hypothetical protein
MEWSTALNRVVWLNLYLGPEPEVAKFVRKQLITDGEEATIVKAIRSAAEGNRKLESIYDGYLMRTNLNLEEVLSEVGMEALVGVVFDLNLGERVKKLQLNRFTDVHEARELVEGFVLKWRGGPIGSYAMGSIWWDGIHPLTTPHRRWISANLEGDPDFWEVFRRWLDDNDALQSWLERLGESQTLVNNGESGEGPVFSAEVAFKIMDLAEVRRCHMQGL